MSAAARRLTPAERAARAEKRRVAEGGRVVRAILSPRAAKALAAIVAAHDVTMTDAIEEGLVLYAQKTVTGHRD